MRKCSSGICRMRCVWIAAIALGTTLSARAADDFTKPIAPDGHFLTMPGGAPFFWLGDTAWSIFTRLTREEASRYLKDRAEKGFNVIQAVAAGAPLDGLAVPNRYGERPFVDEDPS